MNKNRKKNYGHRKLKTEVETRQKSAKKARRKQGEIRDQTNTKY